MFPPDHSRSCEIGDPKNTRVSEMLTDLYETSMDKVDIVDLKLSATGTAPAEAEDASSLLNEEPKSPSHRAPSATPTQIGPLGIQFDYNGGCRVLLPEGSWRVRLSDIDTGNILFETTIGAGRINSSKHYYLRIRIEVWSEGTLVFTHDYDAKGKNVLIQYPVGTLGDTIGWFPYAVKFQRAHGCRLTCSMAERLIHLFENAYPEINFVTHDLEEPENYYATYKMGLFFTDEARVNQPCDFRLVGLHRTAGYILGVSPSEEPPRLVLPDETRPIAEPYICIGTQSTTQAKYWNNPHGWREVIRFANDAGYRVICIDQKPAHGTGLYWNQIPHGAEDETGDRPLAERARWLRHAACFVGLSSGLSWLAWATGAPVVMISGFTHPTNEFSTPYRVINYHACNSCWNDVRVMFDHKEFMWCPRHAGTPRQFECTRLITATQVIQAIKKVPQFTSAARQSRRFSQ
jgi:autotransporter strand-loop-strand O-heptosyltransferase